GLRGDAPAGGGPARVGLAPDGLGGRARQPAPRAERRDGSAARALRRGRPRRARRRLLRARLVVRDARPPAPGRRDAPRARRAGGGPPVVGLRRAHGGALRGPVVSPGRTLALALLATATLAPGPPSTTGGFGGGSAQPVGPGIPRGGVTGGGAASQG